ncbi:hypothetical protein CK203_112445 [Vitis vinifera]|uniref:Uncharacterized protein n=1 Tax=Vitis vinifera TaxID=29760 RepID=A0A438FD83_VITVI|nr:hypothetical protein CK203_112445 [Vitis vinifera]
MIKQVPTYAKFLKDLCTIKRGLHVTKKAFLTEQVSAIIQSKSPVKYKDPGCPTISVNIGGTHVEKALLDLGASVNLLPYSVYKQLGEWGDAAHIWKHDLGTKHIPPIQEASSPEEEEGLEEVCLINTLVEEHCDKNLEENLNESLGVLEEGLPEPSDVAGEAKNRGSRAAQAVDLHISKEHGSHSITRDFWRYMPATSPEQSESCPVRAPLDAPPHLPDSAPSDIHMRRAAATPIAPTQIPPRSPPTKKAKTSELGESSRAPRDSQSQPPPTRRPILASSPIEGNSDCRSRAFHVEAYFDHSILQQPELGDSYRLLERYHLVPFMTPPQFFYPRVALDFYQSMTTRGVPIAEAFHIPYAPADPAAFRHWAPLSEWDMSAEARGHLEALFRISEGYYFGPHHLIMVALLHFEEKVHKRRLTRATPFFYFSLGCYAMFWRIWVSLQTLILTRRHCRESFSLDQWNQVWLHQHSPELPEPREVPPQPLPSISAPSTSAPSEPVPEAASSDAPPAVPPTSEPPLLSLHLGLLPPAPPVAPVPSKPSAPTDDFAPADDATPVASPLLSGGITSPFYYSLAFGTLGTMFILVGGELRK